MRHDVRGAGHVLAPTCHIEQLDDMAALVTYVVGNEHQVAGPHTDISYHLGYQGYL